MSYQNYPVIGPFKGYVDNMPSPHNPANSFDEIRNWLCRKGRFQTRPKLNTFGTPPDGALTRNKQSFLDVQNNWHTVALTTKTAYAVTSGQTFNALTLPGSLTSLAGTALPYGTVVSNSRYFFSNGSCVVMYSDGETSCKDSNAPGAARYMALNNQHMILAYCTEPEPGVAGSRDYPQRVRWSKAGDPTDWTALGSGSNDLIDVPDIITGLGALGRNTMVFRTNGITLMGGTGNASAPFQFENMSSAPEGIGNLYPYSLALYDSFGAFVAKNDIYTVGSGLQLTSIGGASKKRIFSQLEQASGDIVQAFITPRLGPGVDFLSYWLSIPGINKTWVYSWDDDAWSEFTAAGGRITSLSECLVELP